MSGREQAAVEAHLRRLGSDALAAFVADLWRRRGYETTREDGVVVATRDGHAVRIAALVPSRLRPWAASVPADVDIVVAPRGAGGTDVPAGARVLDAADLREMVWYALDESARNHLCGDHLGAAPKYLALPRGARIARRLGFGTAAIPGAGEPISGARATEHDGTATTARSSIPIVGSLSVGSGSLRSVAAAVAVTAVVALLVVSAATGALFPGSQGPGTDTDTDGITGTETPAAVPNGTVATPRPLDPDAPGLGSAGVTNLTALATAHATILENRSYALWLDRYRRPSRNGARSQRDVDVAVEGRRYLVRAGMGDDNDRRIVREVYYDGRDWYVANRSDPTTTLYEPVDGNGSAPLTVPDPFALRTSLVTTYLSTPTTNVTGTVEEGGRLFYRVTGSGTPDTERLAGVENYTVRALVDRRGLVHDLAVEYDDTTLTGAPRVRFEATYGEFGAATATAPAWYDRYFATNGTAAGVVTENGTMTPEPSGGVP